MTPIKVIRSNQYSEHAQLVKALALADALDAADIGSRAAGGMNHEQWCLVASACQVKPPSDETREKAIEMLRAREAIREKLRGKDPFTTLTERTGRL